ncbi:MAG: ATP-grasp fold amidoligase family protein, partial [Erysipelotrichaceae bacterium]|nr:ATP-grasp fold amidoligase family protein [Erysipelotrichaceae bacterium]
MSTFSDNLMSILPDRFYVSLKYFYRFHKFPNLKNPKTYNEKLQWMKLNDHNELYHTLADKYEVKKYVENLIGSEYVIKTLGVYDSFDEIDFNSLPDRFVLKCTHDSGGLVICKEKSKLDKENARKIIESSLKTNYFYHSREWAYKDLKPRIIAEEYIETRNGDLPDYKFFCFDGKARALYVATGRHTESGVCFDFFDENFNHLPFYNSHPNSKNKIDKPTGFDKMKELAEKLSVGMPHVRVDLYDIDGKVYFGEYTF